MVFQSIELLSVDELTLFLFLTRKLELVHRHPLTEYLLRVSRDLDANVSCVDSSIAFLSSRGRVLLFSVGSRVSIASVRPSAFYGCVFVHFSVSFQSVEEFKRS